MTTGPAALYVCHLCAMIGPRVAAVNHRRATGHDVEYIPEEEAREVRETWHAEDRCGRCGSADHYAEACGL